MLVLTCLVPQLATRPKGRVSREETMKKYALIVLGALILLFIATLVAVKPIIKWYVTSNYPVTLNGPISIKLFKEVEFNNVVYETTSIQGAFDKVRVNTSKSILIQGGNLVIQMDSSRDSSNPSGNSKDIKAENLTVSVKKDDSAILFNNTHIDAQQVCFTQFILKHKGRNITGYDGCIQRDKSSMAARMIEANIPLGNLKIPGLTELEHKAVITKVEAHLPTQTIRFRDASIGPFKLIGNPLVQWDSSNVYLQASKLHVEHSWVAPYPAYFQDIFLIVPLDALHGKDSDIYLQVGKSSVEVNSFKKQVKGKAACSDWLDILPKPLLLSTDLEGFTGELGFEVSLDPPKIKLEHNCKFDCTKELIKSIKGRFTYLAYNSKGELFERESGIGSAAWIRIADVGPHIPRSFILMEDPGFYHHKGIHVLALENSIKMNLEKGSFFRGGSTITMQLAKNLWLQRHKTLGRKAYEALLTLALESCFTKAEILEYYMNIVEYGPDLYGIGPATSYYFSKPAQQLELDESFYLASLLPRPKSAIHPKHGGMVRIHKLMERLVNSGILSEYVVHTEVLDTTGWDISD